MNDQTMWVVGVVAVVVAALIGFFVGRMSAGRQRVVELEDEVARHRDSLNAYKQDVAAHFDRTASLFVSMAGSYKDLYEHLSKGYENLAGDAVHGGFKERVGGALLNGSAGAVGAAGAAAVAATAAGEAQADAPCAPQAGAAAVMVAEGREAGTPPAVEVPEPARAIDPALPLEEVPLAAEPELVPPRDFVDTPPRREPSLGEVGDAGEDRSPIDETAPARERHASTSATLP